MSGVRTDDASEGGPHRADVSIIGLGESGWAAARLALDRGESVYVSDTSTDARTSARARELEALGADVELGDHDLQRISASKLVVVSPGIRPDAPVLRGLRASGVRWVTEPEFAVRFHEGSLIAVTGTNGKTTTATLTAHLLGSSGIDVGLGGNVGGGIAPAASELALHRPPHAWWVLELSSFQLAGVESLSPDIGVLTNLAPDHLDWYRGATEYFADKARLFQNATKESRWVVNGDDPEALAMARRAAGQLHLFVADPEGATRSGAASAEISAYVREGVLTLRIREAPGSPGPEESLVARGDIRLLGQQNVMNALAAALAARLAGADVRGIREGLTSFTPLPHRLEPVGERAGVLWVNDSKATNVAATIAAVSSLDRTLVVLLGGKDKGEDFRPLAAALAGRARAIVTYGEAAVRLARELSEATADQVDGNEAPVLVRVDEGFDAAVAAAASLARPGDAILLAPACSSFDLFGGYEERGRRFAGLFEESAR